MGQRQRVEILKALYRQADILILDEPTGVLTPDEADHLFRILKGLKDQGKTIILITHKLREIMAITDTVSVMRQCQMVATVETRDTNPEQLAELMVGRHVLLRVEKGEANPAGVKLSVLPSPPWAGAAAAPALRAPSHAPSLSPPGAAVAGSPPQLSTNSAKGTESVRRVIADSRSRR